MAGEGVWPVPSRRWHDEAIALFTDRARRVRSDFDVTVETRPRSQRSAARLDGIPLAIELAAARVRALSLAEILDCLHDRFRLLTGGARMAVRRQQTLRATVDWSHALLTEPERVLFRRAAVSMGGFDLDAAQAVCGGSDVESYQTLDQLTLLIEKSLVVAEDSHFGTRYRMWRRFASTRWKSSASPARPMRCAPATATTTPRWRPCPHTPGRSGHQAPRPEQAEIEMDNLRSAFVWCRENAENDIRTAARVGVATAVVNSRSRAGGNGLVRCRARRCDRAARRRTPRDSRPGARRQSRCSTFSWSLPTAWIGRSTP